MDPQERLDAPQEIGAETPADENLVELGRLLERYRTRSGLSQRAAAKLSRQVDPKGVNDATISRLERGNWQQDGHQSQPGLATLMILANTYGLTDDERGKIYQLAGYDPAQIPRLPQGNVSVSLWDMSIEDLYELGGRIKAILEYKQQQRQQEP